MTDAALTVKVDVNIPWLTMDEGDCIVANLSHQRRRWINAYHWAITRGRHDLADDYLTNILNFDRMIAKVQVMTDAG